jgi:hypothetical protein
MMLTVAGRGSKTGRRTNHGSGLPNHAPAVGESNLSLVVDLFSGWRLAQEWVRVKFFRCRGERVEAGVVEVSHLDRILESVEESEE